ncbi:hypothetical protein BSFA1_80150 (plasmid) [Burkholderia sp. SFA1]|nr:hypothetical protein BSFA1_80150 [Burkholderia sp. SFA1]
MRWETVGLPASMRKDWLAEWERRLEVQQGWMLDCAGTSDTSSAKSLVKIESVGTMTDAIYEVGRRLARRGRAISANVRPLSEAEARNAELFAARYGVLGAARSTLEAVAAPFGLTRERVRQVVQVMVEKSPLLTYDIAVVAEVAQACLSYVPATTAALTERLRYLLGPNLTIEDANRFSVELLGRQLVRISAPVNSGPGPRVESIAYDPSAPEGDATTEDLKELRAIAYQMIRASGAAHVATITGEAILSGRVSRDAQVRLLMSVEGFEWLDEDESWFWFGPTRPGQNTIVNNMRKVFSVSTEPIDVTDLVAAITRARSKTAHRDFDRPRSLMLIPPLHITRAVLERLDFLSVVQFDDFRAAALLQPRDELSETEMAVYELLKGRGGVASRTEIREELIESGRFLAVTVSLVVDNSPILARIGKGVYALVGWPIDVTALSRAVKSVGGNGSKLTDVTKHEEGGLSFPFVLSEFAARAKVCVLPVAAVPLVPAGQYRVEDTDDLVDCVHRSSGASSFNRLVQVMLSRGCEVGDQLMVRINPAAMTVAISDRRTPAVVGSDAMGQADSAG